MHRIPNGFTTLLYPMENVYSPVHVAQKMKFSIKDIFRKCDHIHSFLDKFSKFEEMEYPFIMSVWESCHLYFK